MKNHDLLTKVLAIAGTILVGASVLLPLFFSLVRLVQIGKLQFDYLMPLELGFLVIGGTGLLIWAAIRAHARIKLIAWAAALAVLTGVGVQLLAVLTGLADGSTPDTSPWMAVLISIVVAFDILVVVLFVAGCLLCKDVLTKPKKVNPNH